MSRAIRRASQRPLLIGVGPRAVATIERGHADLELVDTLFVELEPSALELDEQIATPDRALTVVLFDALDEPLWPAVRAVIRAVRSPTPWLVCPDSRVHGDRGPMLRRLARELAVCVIDPRASDTLAVALTPVAALYRCGLTGIDSSDVATLACPGAVGRVHDNTNSDATDALVVLRCTLDVTLQAISDVAGRIAASLPNANIRLAAPTYSSGGEPVLDPLVLAFSS